MVSGWVVGSEESVLLIFCSHLPKGTRLATSEGHLAETKHGGKGGVWSQNSGSDLNVLPL